MAFCDPVDFPLKIRRQITFGPYVFICKDVNDTVVNLTGYTVQALARPQIESPNTLDLAPVITNAAGGEITIEFTDEETSAFLLGDYNYDLVLENAGGERLNPIVAGTLRVIDVNSRE